jgi:hypothetical protein
MPYKYSEHLDFDEATSVDEVSRHEAYESLADNADDGGNNGGDDAENGADDGDGVGERDRDRDNDDDDEWEDDDSDDDDDDEHPEDGNPPSPLPRPDAEHLTEGEKDEAYRKILVDWYEEYYPDMAYEERKEAIEDRMYMARKDAEGEGEFGINGNGDDYDSD